MAIHCTYCVKPRTVQLECFSVEKIKGVLLKVVPALNKNKYIKIVEIHVDHDQWRYITTMKSDAPVCFNRGGGGGRILVRVRSCKVKLY